MRWVDLLAGHNGVELRYSFRTLCLCVLFHIKRISVCLLFRTLFRSDLQMETEVTSSTLEVN
jgi:hypothetical protein